MKRFVALLLVLCALPIIGFAKTNFIDSFSVAFKSNCATYGLAQPQRPFVTDGLVMYSTDDFQLLLYYEDGSEVFGFAIFTYVRKADFDMVAYAASFIEPAFGKEFVDALLDAVLRYRGKDPVFSYTKSNSGFVLVDKGDDGKPYIAVKLGSE